MNRLNILPYATSSDFLVNNISIFCSSFPKGGNLQSHTVKGFDTSLVENKVTLLFAETRVANYQYTMEMFADQSMLFSGILQPKSPATPNESLAASKTIYVRNLSYIVERTDMYVYFFMLVLMGYFLFYYSNFDVVQGKSFQRLWRNC